MQPHLPFPVIDALPLGAHRLSVLTDEALFETCGVRIMFTGRDGGVSGGPYASLNAASHVGDDIEAVERNRRIICEAAGASHAEIIAPNQVHGTNLVRVERVEDAVTARERAAEGADGIVVETPGVAVLINSADCLSVIVVSPSGSFVIAHAGWRGAVAGIAGKAVRALAEGDDFEPAEYNAYIGPHIHAECFEVGEDVSAQFMEAYGEGVLEDAHHVSLAAAVTVDLLRAGLDERRITDSDICTKCNAERYYSYRATNGECGRHAAFAIQLRRG